MFRMRLAITSTVL